MENLNCLCRSLVLFSQNHCVRKQLEARLAEKAFVPAERMPTSQIKVSQCGTCLPLPPASSQSRRSGLALGIGFLPRELSHLLPCSAYQIVVLVDSWGASQSMRVLSPSLSLLPSLFFPLSPCLLKKNKLKENYFLKMIKQTKYINK